MNGRVAGLRGMESDRACPHGAFAARGVHRYVAIAVEDEAQWRALQGLVPALAAQSNCDALEARLARKAELEEDLAAWCADQEPFALAKRLREAGVPAYVVLRGTDLHRDPQLAAREFFVELDHPRIGPMRYDGAVTRFSRTPARPTRAGPAVGQDTFEVLSDLLGFGEDEIAELAAGGALT